jgi:hypothetical protein
MGRGIIGGRARCEEGGMAGPDPTDTPTGIIRRRFEDAEVDLPFKHGRSVIVDLGGEGVWRSELEAGWSFDDDLKEPYAGGASSCPLTHREYVQAGRIRYQMDDGSIVEASAGDVLFIPPGHRAWVQGDETCVLIDW